ncbi:SDR family NAD(P)-dependent oxidoreductase [archaeon]|nr:MAG: SDR family NAD(P)-dependent oxidoreductase [archaeon]
MFVAHLVGLACLVYALISLCIYIADLYSVLPRKRPVATKHVVVTGGSSGIGLEVARLYLQKGFSVTIVARNKKKLEDASKELYNTKQGWWTVLENRDLARLLSFLLCNLGAIPSEARLQVLSCDVSSSEEDVARIIHQAVKNFGMSAKYFSAFGPCCYICT